MGKHTKCRKITFVIRDYFLKPKRLPDKWGKINEKTQIFIQEWGCLTYFISILGVTWGI